MYNNKTLKIYLSVRLSRFKKIDSKIILVIFRGVNKVYNYFPLI